MRTAEETEKLFRRDLKKLLNKYKADIEIDDHYGGYPECGQDIKALVYIYSEYENDELVQEMTEFDIGRYIDYDRK